MEAGVCGGGEVVVGKLRIGTYIGWKGMAIYMAWEHELG